jgi:hypothetical protein
MSATAPDLIAVLDMRASRPRVGLLGDSISSANILANPPFISTKTRALTLIKQMYNHFEFDSWIDARDNRGWSGMNGAHFGYMTSDVISNKLQQAIDFAPSFQVVSVGICDLDNGISNATIKTNIDVIVKPFLRMNTAVILTNIRPVIASWEGASWVHGGAKMLARADLNSWIENYAATTEGVHFWDVATCNDDGTGHPISGRYVDGLHPHQLGAHYEAMAGLPLFKSLIKPLPNLIPPFASNLMPSPIFTTLGSGILGNGVSRGSIVANGYKAQTNRRATIKVNAGILPNPETGGNNSVFDFVTPSTGGASAEFFFFRTNPSAISNTLPNMWVKARCVVSLTPWTQWRQINFQVAPYIGAGVGAGNGVEDSYIPDVMLDFDLETPPCLMPSSPSDLEPVLTVCMDATRGATSGRMQVSQMEIIPVYDPIYLHRL